MNERIREVAQKLSEDLTDAGKIIEGGWTGFRLAVLPQEASNIQVTETRKAFFAGALHLFDSIMAILDPGSEPTERDLNRMTLIHKELKAFEDELRAQVRPQDRR